MNSSSAQPAPKRVAVIGAGIVGICCALYLQRDGHEVTVFDPQEPGEGCSKGNMGIIAVDHCVPESTPGILWQVPGMLLDPLGPLTMRWRYLPRALPWLLRFVAASRRKPFRAACHALHALNVQALTAFEPLLESAKAASIIQRQGLLLAFESSETFAKATPLKIEARREMGLKVELLDARGVRDLEPALSDSIRHGVYYPEVAHATDPFRFVQVLAEDFRRQGGAILREKVESIGLENGRVRSLRGGGRQHETDAVVLAAGAHSNPLTRQMGASVPLETERGYHAMFPEPGVVLKQPVISGDFHCAITPMEQGLRVGGTIEFAGLDAEPNYARADKLVSVARRLLPGLNTAGQSQWMGHRPALPDSLPVIGPSPKVEGAWFAYGHGMVGLTQGAITGKLIAELVLGKPTTIDVTPYRADRF